LNAPLNIATAADEYLSWLQLEANRSPNTIRAYRAELARFRNFLAGRGHSLAMEEVGHEDLRAFQRHLADTLRQAASRQRALVALRSWLRWLAREQLVEEDLSNKITVPKVEQRLPKPLSRDETAQMLRKLPGETELEKRDRALVYFLITTGCRISEALALDRTDIPLQGNRVIVSGKGAKQRAVYLTDEAKAHLESYLKDRVDTSLALFINYDRSVTPGPAQRLTTNGARHVVRRLRRELGVWAFRTPHVARHTTATSLLEVTGGDVRLVQEVLGHANLATLQGYTKIVDQRKQDAYKSFERYLENDEPGGPRE
jgi:integrase/recombinase XerD